MPEDKLRLRTDDELVLQNKGLIEIKKILESNNIEYFLSGGTLLGAVREKNFIRWDWDVSLYLKTEDVFDKRQLLFCLFKDAGFKVDGFDESYKNLKYVIYKYNTKYEIAGYWLEGSTRYRSAWKIPAHFFEDVQTIGFLGEVYPCMTPAEAYLEYTYGDWRTPKKESVKERYLSEEVFLDSKWKRKIKPLKSVIRKAIQLMKK